MTSPVLLGYFTLFLKELRCCLSFQEPHGFRYRILGGNRDDHVDVIGLDVNLLHRYLISLPAQFVEVIAGEYFRPTLQHLVAVLRAEYNVVRAQPDSVR